MELTQLQQVKQAIMFGEFTNDELNSLGDAIRFARAQKSRENARTFKVGDAVKFRDSKRGVTYTGTVDKIKIKYALVKTGSFSRFNVPLNMLESA